VILSDLHDFFQTTTGRETSAGISDAATRRQVCPFGRAQGEKSGQRKPEALTAGLEFSAQAQVEHLRH
jgi:hypothetical protein